MYDSSFYSISLSYPQKMIRKEKKNEKLLRNHQEISF